MPKYVLAYHGGDKPKSPEEGAKNMAKWQAWLGGLGDAVVSPATPLSGTQTVSRGRRFALVEYYVRLHDRRSRQHRCCCGHGPVESVPPRSTARSMFRRSCRCREVMEMTDFKLTYFDFSGGRGEPVRIAFHTAGISFEDHRISFEEFMKTRETMRFECAPVLHIDGVEVTQSNAMLRFVGKHAGLYPDDPLQAMYCDEAMDAVEDMLHQIVHTFGLEGEELKNSPGKAHQRLADCLYQRVVGDPAAGRWRVLRRPSTDRRRPQGVCAGPFIARRHARSRAGRLRRQPCTKPRGT